MAAHMYLGKIITDGDICQDGVLEPLAEQHLRLSRYS